MDSTDAESGGKDVTSIEAADVRRAGRSFVRLVEIMRRLRGPDGCPWDREQDWRSLRRYTLEEAYEVVQAIDDGEPSALAAELGDLLLQIVFLSQIADEDGSFSVADVAESISDKLVRRHPHVFGDVDVDDADEVVRNWEELKHGERGTGSLVDDVPRSLPALERAQKLGKRASQLRFDWPGPGPVLDKVREETEELAAAMSGGAGDVEEELGDLLFAIANLARHLRASGEVALNAANVKFERRFRRVEDAVRSGRCGDTPDEMEAEWERVKAAEAVEPADAP